MNIKDIELTNDDFDLIIDGLKNLPNKNFGTELMGAMMEGMLGDKADPEKMAKYRAEKEAKRIKAEREKKEMEENIMLLQGKLIMFKRWLQQEDMLKEAKHIINGPRVDQPLSGL